jgi:hypothetical protein
MLQAHGRNRNRPEFLQRSGGVAARLGAIHELVLPFTIRDVRNVELVLVEIELADFGMTHAADSVPATHICACPQFAETRTGRGQFSDQRLHARIIWICAGGFP